MPRKVQRGATETVDVATALKPKLFPVEKMRPHPRNPRTHPEDQVAGLGNAFEEFGVLQIPVLDENGTILAGEGRWRAAQSKGLSMMPVIQVKGWSEDRKVAFMLADNRWAQLGGFDNEKLRSAVVDLVDMGYDLQPVGYEGPALADILGDVATLDGMPELSADDRAPFQQMSFIVHDEDVIVVREAIKQAHGRLPKNAPSLNQNKNGAALALICKQYLKAKGGK